MSAPPAIRPSACVEPQKRMVGGRYGWAIHRFPIKGGITLAAAWTRELRAGVMRRGFFDSLVRGERKTA